MTRSGEISTKERAVYKIVCTGQVLYNPPKPKKKNGEKKKKELVSKTVSTTTPRQTGIKKAFEMSRKREAASSPEDQNESKSQRHEGT